MTWIWVAIAVALDGAVALVGGFVPDRWLQRYRTPMLGFATGTLLASGLGKLLPEALAHEGRSALVMILVAMIAVGMIEWVSRRRGRHRERPVVPGALLASDALHNLGDGIAIAAGFLVDIRLGAITSATVMLHELPEELADYALLRSAGMSRRAALSALAAVQLTAGIGAAGTLLASSIVANAEGVVLSIACGMFVYIAVIDLLPELWRTRARSALVAGLIGAVLVLLLG